MKTVQMQIESKQNSRRSLIVKNKKEAQFSMRHGNLQNDQITFEIEPVCEKLKRKKFGLILDEIKFEEKKEWRTKIKKLKFVSCICRNF